MMRESPIPIMNASLFARALPAALLAASLTLLSSGALAQARPAPGAAAPAGAPGGAQATLVATFNDWGAYTAQTGRAKICYALSQPKARQPANLKDTPAYLFVSFRPGENVKNEVAAVLGFPTKDGGPAEASVNQTTYALVTKGANAWIKNPAEEGQAVATMSRGQSITVSATSARGNKTTDRYSLAGFAQALDRARKECP
jgi:invasion protein IalB